MLCLPLFRSGLVMCFVALIGMAPASQRRVIASELQVNVVDQNSRRIPCRVLVRDSAGDCHVPDKAVLLDIGTDHWFMSDGEIHLDVPDGDYELRVEHGLEYTRFKSHVTVPATGLKETVSLTRWVNMHDRGYLCGESHLHVDVDSVGPMAVAEGLDFGSSLTWWNGPDARRPLPDGSDHTRTLPFAGQQITASVFDAELEHPWGAAYVQSLPHPFPQPSDPHRPNLDFLRYAVQHDAIVHYQGGWSREVGLDALLGLVHTVNVCNNNFHLHRFQPRSRYSNLLSVDGFPTYPNTETGMMEMNTATWYRLLNWGLRLASGAGSATGVKQVPAGYNRAYVRVHRDASLQEFNDAWKAGRNFVTNGPVILLNGPDGEPPGDDINRSESPGALEFSLTVLSDEPLQTIEIVQNGDVVRQFSAKDTRESQHQFQLHVESSCWIAARCTARDEHLTDEELQRYDNPPLQRPSRLRFAHTSPIYVTVNGRTAIVRESVEEGLRMLDRLEVFANEQAAPEWQIDFRRAVGQARDVLRKKLLQQQP